MIDDTFLTVAEVLEYLQVNSRTVYRLIKAGKLPAIRIGRQWRFRRRDLDAWLDREPAGRPVHAEIARRHLPRADRGRPRVLVVDDEESIRDQLMKMLATEDYQVDAVPDGPTAIERMRLKPYDLLVTDLRLPGIDGLALVREMKRLKSDLAVIVVTGYSTESAAIEALNLGVAGYLTKPFRMRQVLNKAASALGLDAE
jgi:excisionase family DNA binding protein